MRMSGSRLLFAAAVASVVGLFSTGCGSERRLVALQVTPATASIPFGASQPFTACGTFNRATLINVPVSSGVSWSSSDTTIATINSNGVATAVGCDTVTITAVSGGLSSTAELTTCAPPSNSGSTCGGNTVPIIPFPKLTLVKQGTGTGTVSDTTLFIDCGPTCPTATAFFASGTTVTLIATPAGNSIFGGWGIGSCDSISVSGTTCTLVLNTDRQVVAIFL